MSRWKIICGDCLTVLPRLPEPPKLIFADPPYNIGVDYGDGKRADRLPRGEYLKWSRRWLEACAGALAADGSLWVLAPDEWAGYFAVALDKIGLTRRNWITWYESFGNNCSRKFNRTSRHLLYAVADPDRFTFNLAAVSRPSDRQRKYHDKRANPAGKVYDDVSWRIPRLVGTHKERIPGFPTQLPLKLLRRVVAASTHTGDLVVDPFSGSATTGVAAVEAGCRYIGIEQSAEFCAVQKANGRDLSRKARNMSSDLMALSVNPLAFVNELTIPTGRGPRVFGDVLAAHQRETFETLAPCLRAVAEHKAPPIPRFWIERTKGASKDTDVAVCLLWLLAFSKRPLRVQVGAYDSSQADEVRQIIQGILRLDPRLNRFLAEVLDVTTSKIRNVKTNSECEILASDRWGSHGARPDCVCVLELTHQPDKTFPSTLLDNSDKVPTSLVIVQTNAGFDPSYQLSWKQLFATTPRRWKILEYKGRPHWVDKAAWREAERRNSPNRFARLFRGEWVGNEETAFSSADVDALVKLKGPISGAKRGWQFVAGLDLGLSKHSSALAVVGVHVGHVEEIPAKPKPMSRDMRAMIDAGIVDPPDVSPTYEEHPGTGKLRLAWADVWTPKPGRRVSLEAVKQTVIDVDERFHLQAVGIDPWQAALMEEQLREAGLPVRSLPQSTPQLQEQATALTEVIQERRLELYPFTPLLVDLKRLKLKDNGQRIRLVSPERNQNTDGTGHGDLASALSFAVYLARQTHTLDNRAPDSILCY